MANQRVFDEVSLATFNGVSVGGITSINTTEDYLANINADLDFSAGPSERLLGGQQVKGQLRTSDVLTMIVLLNSTPAASLFFGKESGSANYQKTDLKNPRFFKAVFDADVSSLATITADFQCIFDPTDTFADIQQVTGGIIPSMIPAKVQPSRLWRPKTATFGALPLTPVHLQGLSFQIAARGGGPLVDFGDGDIGTTVVDVPGWDVVTVTLTIRDSKETVEGVSTKDVATLMIEEGVGDLAVVLAGVGNVADKTLTLDNCSFHSRQKAGGPGWTGHTLNGVLQWRDPLTPFDERDLVTNPLIAFA